MKLKNLIAGLKFQLPVRRFFKNFFITGNGWGLFHKNSHINQSTGNPKVKYNSLGSAQKAATSMMLKHGKHFSVYRCVYCDGYHLGKNRENK